MWALFLVAFFTFLRKSNLVPDVADRISTKVPLRADLEFSSQGASVHIKASKTIQYQQRSLSIPLPCIPGSQLCPVRALSSLNFIRLLRVVITPSVKEKTTRSNRMNFRLGFKASFTP